MDLSKTGLDMFFKSYQIKALEVLWESTEPLSSRVVWEQVNMDLSISRASIINFLNACVELGLLDYSETTGKGGYRRLYSARVSRFEIKDFLTRIIQEQLQTLAS